MISKEEQRDIWNTNTLNEFRNLNYDQLLFPSNIEGMETYIKLPNTYYNGKKIAEGETIQGFECVKKHKDDIADTLYFVRTQDVNNMPLLIKKSEKVMFSKKVYNLVTESVAMRIKPEKKMSWKQLVQFMGLPYHENPVDYALYKNKILYGRTNKQFYYRVVSPSAFGKTKLKESIKLLTNNMTIVSDPSAPKLFYAICRATDVTLNEMPDYSTKSSFIKFCNMLMNIGDKSKGVENPSRSINGTKEYAETDKLSVSFTHNPPDYYHKVGERGFDDIFPENVISRYYYNYYTGVLNFSVSESYNAVESAIKYQGFLKDWIKTMLWYEENWDNIINPFGTKYLDLFEFANDRPRFKDHFVDFAKCLAEFCDGDERKYAKLLKAEYDSHKKYEEVLKASSKKSVW